MRAAAGAAVAILVGLSTACGGAGSGGASGGHHRLFGGAGAGSGPLTGTPGTLVATNAAAPHPSPLPTSAVDASRFPLNDAARRASAIQTVHVAKTGSDAAAGTAAAPFRTIRKGLESASAAPSTRVVVHGGTYLEGDPQDNVCFNIDADGTIVEAAPGETVLVQPGASIVSTGVEIHANHVTWSGISFAGFDDHAIGLGAHAKSFRDIVIADLAIQMNRGSDGIAVYYLGTSAAPAVSGLLIEGVRVVGADQAVTIASGFVSDVALVDCTLQNRTTTAQSGGDAFATPSGDNFLLNGVEVVAPDGNGIDLHATRCAVVNCYVHGCGKNGVALYQGGDIVNTLIHDCDAIYMDVENPVGVTTTCRVVGSVMAFQFRGRNASAYPMTVGYDHPTEPIALEITNSIFYRNPGAPVISQGTRAVIRGSLFFGSANGTAFEYDSDANGNTQAIDATSGVAALSGLATIASDRNLEFATDPLFADPQASSMAGFRLLANSPLIDAGVVASPFAAIDLVGSTRALGRAPDVGPLEAR